MIISRETYFNDLEVLISKIDYKYDCIVALKRSGWIIGVVMYNRFNIPLYTEEEVPNIPSKFTKVLVIDDKVSTGKSITKVVNKLLKQAKLIHTASLYIEKTNFTNYFTNQYHSHLTMWYEVK